MQKICYGPLPTVLHSVRCRPVGPLGGLRQLGSLGERRSFEDVQLRCQTATLTFCDGNLPACGAARSSLHLPNPHELIAQLANGPMRNQSDGMQRTRARLCRQLLDRDPKKRPSADEALAGDPCSCRFGKAKASAQVAWISGLSHALQCFDQPAVVPGRNTYSICKLIHTESFWEANFPGNCLFHSLQSSWSYLNAL